MITRHIISLILFLSLAVCVQELCAEDVVVTRNPDSGQTVKRRGEIADWKGSSLELNANGNIRIIDNDEIVEIQTTWPQSYNSASILLSSRKFEQALEKLNEAGREEQRPWALRIIRARMIECYDALGANQMDQVRQFLAISTDDPDTRFMNLIPIAWTGSVGFDNASQQVQALIDSDNLAAQLIGASWSLSGSKRSAAINKLEALASDINPQIAALAQAQLWKTAVKTSDEELAKWESRIERMPRGVRAGPYFVLAESLARNGQVDAAALTYMRVPILHPQQHSLAAASLYQCGDLLQNKGNAVEASTLWNELIQKYPQSFWAQQARARLTAAASGNRE